MFFLFISVRLLLSTLLRFRFSRGARVRCGCHSHADDPASGGVSFKKIQLVCVCVMAWHAICVRAFVRG